MAIESGGFTLRGGKELAALLKDLPLKLQAKVTRTGLRKAANRTRNVLRRAAPKISGRLRQSISVKVGKRGKAWIGLRDRFYYKTLEFDTARGPATHPFFLEAWSAHEAEIAQMLIDETRKALYQEAGRIHAKANFRK